MKKTADIYFKINPWKIIESQFDKEYSLISESIFSIGNEYMGMRGYFEEGYSGDTLIGSYVTGIYERKYLGKAGYKGLIENTEFMVNTVDYLYTRILCNDVSLDLYNCDIKNFNRELDMKTGILTRNFIWNVSLDTVLYVEFQRFLSMTHPNFGGQKISFGCLKGKANIKVESGIDFSRKHMTMDENFWNCQEEDIKFSENYCEIIGKTKNTNQTVFASAMFNGDFKQTEENSREKFVSLKYETTINANETAFIEKIIYISNEKPSQNSSFKYEDLKSENIYWWNKCWKHSDIEIQGDEKIQQGIRYSIFQLTQTLHTSDYGAIIGAKGLTGEVYNGNTFWDSEVYCLPFYLFTNPEAAKSILKFRYNTLNQAKARAKDLDCEGAFYPIATISGDECCSLWQHASTQLQASTAVMYGIHQYINCTLDYDFLYDYGVEMLIEISRMLATRGDYNPITNKYGYYAVMGPDEFQLMVNNNCYTNFMAKKTFEYTEKSLLMMEKDAPVKYENLIKKINLLDEERKTWNKMMESMYIPYDENTKLFEQHDGFYSLPKIDIKKIPMEDFPLYHHWSYDRIYRNNMIKQPDVLMFMFMYNSEFTFEELEKNYNYYEPLCIHESSLSPSVHSILASQIGKEEDVYRFLDFATRLDLDNYNRNTNEGLHITSLAGAWMNIVYGFAGLRSDGKILSFSPKIPKEWDKYSFSIFYHNAIIKISITKDHVEFSTDRPLNITINVYGKDHLLDENTLKIER